MEKGLVVITGASSGFGKEMARVFHDAGHPLLLIARRTELIEALNLDNVMIRKVDVTDADAFQSSVNEAVAQFGPVDLLINNAGVMLLGNIWNQDPQEWQTMINVNVSGVLNGTRSVIESMIERESGTIINISSIAGFKTFTNHAVYSATKYGVHALSETLRQEISGSNVRVLVLSPGAAETELLSHTSNQKIKDDYVVWKDTMGGYSMDPRHVANAALMMFSLPQEVSIRELVIAPTKQDN
ncbi:SDR family oxidoreductase [Erysipelothrix sp. HDW6C]|uniref:SDR family oxidoreductase n=1 Tax=Erysipelothrix sp. HDW6C TaxID=2714930 RepID=UPI00140BDA25|nr:SDR family oxidoreductase [Erysipelothrix sp. HDW6C]QIK69577.1 SDR family oxidoreductase [Erysipelothrix sp. HDW6C]